MEKISLKKGNKQINLANYWMEYTTFWPALTHVLNFEASGTPCILPAKHVPKYLQDQGLKVELAILMTSRFKWLPGIWG